MTGNIKFDSDSDYVGALVSDQDHVIMMGSKGEGAIMGSVSAGHSQTQVDAVINANLNNKKASVQATRTTDGGSNVVIEAQDPDSANAVSVKVGAKAADVTGGTLSVYREANSNKVDVGNAQLKIGGGYISGDDNGIKVFSPDSAGGGSFSGVVFNGPEKTITANGFSVQTNVAPTNDNDLANKKYVDSKVGGGDYLPLSGGTMRGSINLNRNDLRGTDYVTYDAQD